MRPRRFHLSETLAVSLVALTGCGQTEAAGPSLNTAGGDAGGAASLGTGTNAGGPGEAGAVAATPEVEPAQIAGRWGLFVFDDPVGVQLKQDGSTLSGLGCAAGAPPLMDSSLQGFCGPITGSVEGQLATFHFNFESYGYLAKVVVEPAGQRMTGSFHGVGPASWPTAWLPVADDALWLASPPPKATVAGLLGGYRLEPVPGSEPGAPVGVELWYREEGIASGLGSFFHSELRRDGDGTIWAGPVPPTSPELAVSLELVTVEDDIVSVVATLGDGRQHELSAERM